MISKMSARQKFLFAALVLVFSSASVFAQSGWAPVQRASNGDLVSVFFISAERGFVGGDAGYLAATADGGRNWTRLPLDTKENINEIYFRNDDNGYVLAGSRIYLSNDGGRNWRESKLINAGELKGLTPDFLSVRFTGRRKGWIVGSVSNRRDEVVDSLVLHTTDGGETWQRVRVPAKVELYHLDFANDERGWLVGDKGTILYTEDEGITWAKQTSGTSVSIYNVDFRDSKDGAAVGGEGVILRTENGGETWRRVVTNVTRTLLRVSFADDKNGWAVGGGGIILRTDDKGRTWLRQESGSLDSLYGLYVDKRGGWAVGRKGIVLRYKK